MKIISGNESHVIITVQPYQTLSILHDLTKYTQAICEVVIYLKRNSVLDYTAVITGTHHIQKKIFVHLQEPHARVRIKGVYSMHADGKLELETVQHHHAPDTVSTLSYNGIAHDVAQTIYQGMIRIDECAPRSDAAQENKTLLLSDGARAHSVPSIEVLNNDVLCAHGSAIGYLDGEQLVYMQSRGIAVIDAQRLLVTGFCEKQLAFVEAREVKSRMVCALLKGLN